MKIPKTVAQWMYRGSILGVLATAFSPSYFSNRRNVLLENSPTHLGEKGIREELPKLEERLALCFPRSEESPLLREKVIPPEYAACFEDARRYDKLNGQLKNLHQDPEYVATLEKADKLTKASKYSSLGLFPVIALGAIGLLAYKRRENEELLEKNPELAQKIEELQKYIKR